MTDPLNWGHLAMLVGLLIGLYGLWQAAIWAKHRGFGPGTPQYARARDGRRYAAWSLTAVLFLFAIGCLTALRDMPIT
jgi:hypothetical protein